MEDQIIYRLASDSDIAGINSLYNSVYNKNRTTEQFTWEYNSAPAGKSIYVIAEYNGSVIGTQCVIPYYLITADNRKILTGKSEDTLVSPIHRGKRVFENMYNLLIEECRKNKIEFIWGFTYATKSFLKIGFEVPFAASMALLVLKPGEAAQYFNSITASKGQIARLKIFGMCCLSNIRFRLLALKKYNVKKIDILNEKFILNSDTFNYIQSKDNYGLYLDKDFINYRISQNPYNKDYYCYSWKENGELKACVYFNITKENVGYILHLYLNKNLSAKESEAFIQNCVIETELRKTSVVRFWGFEHNQENSREVEHLSSAGFLKLNRGISFVFKRIIPTFNLDINHFVLSRMASQGTD